MHNQAPILRVRNWDAHYEVNRTRCLKTTLWVPVPNRLDNDGYLELVTHASGAAHLGAWLSLLQVASRCKPRGTLVRDDGSPHSVETLARITRLPADVFNEAIPRLLSIGWIESIQGDGPIAHEVAETQHGNAGLRQQTDVSMASGCILPVTVGRKEGMEGREGNTPAESWNPETAFDELWEAYPSKGRTRRPLSQQYFLDHVCSLEAFQVVIDAVRGKWARSEKWAKGFIMALPSWLDQECWLEDPEPAGKQAAAEGGPVYRSWAPPKPSPEPDDVEREP